jgi:hypothetical protein
VSQTHFFVLFFVVPFEAVALVVIDQILTAAMLTCLLWAVRNVNTSSNATRLDFLLEATVADALVVVLVLTSRLLQVNTFSMFSALITNAIVHVLATRVCSEDTRSLAARSECDRSQNFSIGREACITMIPRFVGEHKLLMSSIQGALWWNHNRAFHGGTSVMRLI